MAKKVTSTKSSSRAKSGNIKISSSTGKKIKKSAKKIQKSGVKTMVMLFAFLILGAGLGAGACWLVCREDCFTIIGSENVVLALDETYSDDGTKVVSFGQDVSNGVTIETNLTLNQNGEYYATEIGTYYIKYSSTDFKYGTLFKVEKVRLVTFVEASEGGEV